MASDRVAMRIAVRVDASIAIGSGHLMRCLALAEEVIARDGSAVFMMATCPAPLQALVAASGAELALLPTQSAAAWEAMSDAAATLSALQGMPPVDWLVVDHYGIASHWERQLVSTGLHVMVIDDLANRPHAGALLLDQNLWRNSQQRYVGLVDPDCRLLLGPRYALLRHEFLNASSGEQTARSGLLVSFGGTDPSQETVKMLEALPLIGARLPEVNVVVGAAHPALKVVRERASLLPGVRLHVQTRDMARLLAGAALAVGAGGSSHWERMWFGVPTICTAVADNQIETCELLHERGAVCYLGTAAKIATADYASAVADLLADCGRRETMAAAGRTIMGEGPGTARVVDEMLALIA